MSDLNVKVYAGGEREPARLDVYVPEATTLAEMKRAAAASTLEFEGIDGTTQTETLEHWEVQALDVDDPRFASRFAFVGPASIAHRVKPDGAARLDMVIPRSSRSPRRQFEGKSLVLSSSVANRALEAAELFASYPIITAPGPDGAGGGGGGGAPASGDARAIIKQEMRAVLGRTPSGDDVTATLAALDRRFVARERNGVTQWEWTPGSYVGQNDVGAGVTGEQASLVAFAQRASDEIAPCVGELRALKSPCENPEAVEIARSGFRASWQSFVGSLGQEGGLPTARCKVLLKQAREQLATLGEELGMLKPVPAGGAGGAGRAAGAGRPSGDRLDHAAISRAAVLTRDDEEQLTHFIIACDRVKAVSRAFDELTGRTAVRDYGTAFTQLQRDLELLPELVADVRWALDSVDFGPDQREVQRVGPGAASMTLEGVLQWAEDLAEEGRSLLQDAGVRGAELLQSRAAALHDVLAALEPGQHPKRDGDVFAARLALARVRTPLRLLGEAVARVKQSAAEIRRLAR
jgi:hypothetical protein